jgi:hypothetical protein
MLHKFFTLPLIANLLFINICTAQLAKEQLDINNVNATILNCGDMFWNPSNNSAGYELPKGSGKNSNFAAGL